MRRSLLRQGYQGIYTKLCCICQPSTCNCEQSTLPLALTMRRIHSILSALS
jgi:hypothetical protein